MNSKPSETPSLRVSTCGPSRSCRLRRGPLVLSDEHLAKIVALAAEHKFLGVRLGGFKEIEFRIGDDADALERHQGTHDVRKIRRQTKRIIVHHVGEIVSQLFEIYVLELAG